MKKGTSSKQVTAMNDRTPKLEVIPPKPKTIADIYRQSVSVRRGIRGRPRLYQNKEELIDGIQRYFDDIINHDGTYNRPPTWGGLGLFLGFASKEWDTNYRNTDEFGEVIDQTRQAINTWRTEQAAVPSKGVNPAGVMFLMNREDAQAARYAELKDITPTEEDTRPKEAAALIDDVWRKKNG